MSREEVREEVINIVEIWTGGIVHKPSVIDLITKN
jgi:hypothetical protein